MKSSFSAIAMLGIVSVMGCRPAGTYPLWEYDGAFFLEADGGKVDSVSIKTHSNEECETIKCLELNGAILELDGVSPEEYEAFLDQAKIKHERTVTDKRIYIDDETHSNSYSIEGRFVEVFMMRQDGVIQARHSLKKITLPASTKDLKAAFGKPNKIGTARSSQP